MRAQRRQARRSATSAFRSSEKRREKKRRRRKRSRRLAKLLLAGPGAKRRERKANHPTHRTAHRHTALWRLQARAAPRNFSLRSFLPPLPRRMSRVAAPEAAPATPSPLFLSAGASERALLAFAPCQKPTPGQRMVFLALLPLLLLPPPPPPPPRCSYPAAK